MMAAQMELPDVRQNEALKESLKRELAILDLCIEGAASVFSGTNNQNLAIALQEQSARVRKLLKRLDLLY